MRVEQEQSAMRALVGGVDDYEMAGVGEGGLLTAVSGDVDKTKIPRGAGRLCRTGLRPVRDGRFALSRRFGRVGDPSYKRFANEKIDDREVLRRRFQKRGVRRHLVAAGIAGE